MVFLTILCTHATHFLFYFIFGNVIWFDIYLILRNGNYNVYIFILRNQDIHIYTIWTYSYWIWISFILGRDNSDRTYILYLYIFIEYKVISKQEHKFQDGVLPTNPQVLSWKKSVLCSFLSPAFNFPNIQLVCVLQPERILFRMYPLDILRGMDVRRNVCCCNFFCHCCY